MITAKRYGPWALIAGGSEGVGASFAQKLADIGINLVLVARRPEPLDKLAQELRSKTNIAVRTLSLDLKQPDMLDRICEVTDDIDVGLLIFNAGNTGAFVGSFLDRPLEEALTAAKVTTIGQTTLAHHFGGKMVARRHGGIILVGSISGSSGIPNQATYCAAKAYTQILAEALWCELKPHGVDVLSLVLGLTDTPARIHNGVAVVESPDWPVLPADDVAEQALCNLENGGPVHIPPPYDSMFRYFSSTPRRLIAEAHIQWMNDAPSADKTGE